MFTSMWLSKNTTTSPTLSAQPLMRARMRPWRVGMRNTRTRPCGKWSWMYWSSGPPSSAVSGRKTKGTKNDASCKGETWESDGHQRDAVSSLGVQLEQEVLFSSFLHAPLQGISLHPGWPHQPPWKHSSAVWAAARRMLCYGTSPKCHLSHAIFAVWHWSGCLLSYFNYICPVCLCIK